MCKSNRLYIIYQYILQKQVALLVNSNKLRSRRYKVARWNLSHKRRLIFNEGGPKWLVSSVRVNRGWSPKGLSRQLVEVSESRRLHGCGDRLHDDRPSPFHGHSKGSKRDGGALLPPCTVLSDKRRLRHAMQNDPIIAAGETGSWARGMRELIRILLARDEGATGTGKVDTGKCGGALPVNSNTQSNPSDVG